MGDGRALRVSLNSSLKIEYLEENLLYGRWESVTIRKSGNRNQKMGERLNAFPIQYKYKGKYLYS